MFSVCRLNVVGSLSRKGMIGFFSVIFDSAEGRWRTVAEVVPEYKEINFDNLFF